MQTTRPPWIAAAALVAGGVSASALIALLGALYVAAVGTAYGRHADAEALQAFPDHGSVVALAEAAMRPVRAVSVALVALVVSALAFRRAGASAAIAVAALIAAANVSAIALEELLGAVDPLGGEHERVFGPAFFPSGHATAVTSIVLGVTIALAPARWPPRAGVWLAALAGLAIVTSDAHLVSDVLAAYLLAAAWAVVVTSCMPARRRADVAAAVAWDRATWGAIAILVAGATALQAAAAIDLVDSGHPRLTISALAVLVCAASVPAAVRLALAMGERRPLDRPL